MVQLKNTPVSAAVDMLLNSEQNIISVTHLHFHSISAVR